MIVSHVFRFVCMTYNRLLMIHVSLSFNSRFKQIIETSHKYAEGAEIMNLKREVMNL